MFSRSLPGEGSQPSDDGSGTQIGDRVVTVAEPAQHLVGVLAEVRGWAQFFGLGSAGHIDRLADGLQRSELWMVNRAGHLEMLDLRVGEGLVDRIDRPA